MEDKKESKVSAINQNKEKYGRKIGRNEKCPCGSNLKYKNCCYENDKINK